MQILWPSCYQLIVLFVQNIVFLPLSGFIPTESLPGEGLESVSLGLITDFGQCDMCHIHDNALRAIPPFPTALSLCNENNMPQLGASPSVWILGWENHVKTETAYPYVGETNLFC